MANFTSYSGPASNFPPKDQWKGLDELFNANKGEMSQMGNTDGDNTCVYNAVRQCADSIGVEDRVIFCMIMQVGHSAASAASLPTGKIPLRFHH